jgi:hypothetical protein
MAFCRHVLENWLTGTDNCRKSMCHREYSGLLKIAPLRHTLTRQNPHKLVSCSSCNGVPLKFKKKNGQASSLRGRIILAQYWTMLEFAVQYLLVYFFHHTSVKMSPTTSFPAQTSYFRDEFNLEHAARGAPSNFILDDILVDDKSYWAAHSSIWKISFFIIKRRHRT